MTVIQSLLGWAALLVFFFLWVPTHSHSSIQRLWIQLWLSFHSGLAGYSLEQFLKGGMNSFQIFRNGPIRFSWMEVEPCICFCKIIPCDFIEGSAVLVNRGQGARRVWVQILSLPLICYMREKIKKNKSTWEEEDASKYMHVICCWHTIPAFACALLSLHLSIDTKRNQQKAE